MLMYLDLVRRSHLFAFFVALNNRYFILRHIKKLKRKSSVLPRILDIEKRMYRASKQHARKEEKDSFIC